MLKTQVGNRSGVSKKETHGIKKMGQGINAWRHVTSGLCGLWGPIVLRVPWLKPSARQRNE